MFSKIGKWVTGHPKKIIAFWIALLLAGSYFAINLPGILAAGGFNDPKSESMLAKEILDEEFTNKYPQNLIVVLDSEEDTVDSVSYNEKVNEIKSSVENEKFVEEVTTYYDNNEEQFVSEDGKTTYLAIGLSATENEATNMVADIEKKVKTYETDSFQVDLTGGPALTYTLNEQTKKEVTKAEMIAIPIMLIILVLVFRSVASAVLPLMMALFALGSTMAVSYFIGQQMTLNILITNIISMIGLGVVVDYALFMVSRFKKELKKSTVTEAVRRTVETSGRAVFYSGITVAISLSALFIPNMMIFTSIALGGVIVVAFAILVSLTLLPAFLMLLGEKINWGRIPLFKEKESRVTTRWERISNRLMARPILFLLPGLAILLFFAWPALNTNMQVPVASASVIPEDTSAREGFEILTDKFSQGDIFPIEVVIQSQEETLFTEEHLKEIDKLTSEFEKLDNVDHVTSITNWNDEWEITEYAKAYENFDGLPSEVKGQLNQIINSDQDSKTALIMVASEHAAESVASHDVVNEIRDIAEDTDSLSVFVGGETAIGLDFDERVFDNLPLIIISVFVISFLILVITFKSILIPVKAILLNALVTLASVGVLVLVFQNDFSFVSDSAQTINSITPVVLFAVLFGLSMDYEVIIISRMKELYDSGAGHEESISKGIASTAGIVNGAAAIMIAVFTAFALVEIRVVAELGLGLAFAIIVDAILVRTIFVPILMKLMGKANWWLPFRKKPKHKSQDNYSNRSVGQ